jgi:four helix bundle protein
LAVLRHGGCLALGMKPKELRARLDRFADQVTSFCRSVATDPLLQPLLVQLLKSATSTAANYRAACRAQTRAAFVSKLSIALEEADEAMAWLQRLTGQGAGDEQVATRLIREADEICAILNASRLTAQGRRRRK